MRSMPRQRIIQNTPYGEYMAVSGAMGDAAFDPRGYPGRPMPVDLNPEGTIVPTNGFGRGAYARRPMSDAARLTSYGVLQGRQVFTMPVATGRRRGGGYNGYGDATALPSIPGLSIPGLPVMFELRNNLWIVSSASQPAVMPVLQQMAYSAGSSTSTNETGTAGLFAGTPPLAAADVVNKKVAAGYAALVNKASVTTGILQLLFTNSPSELASAAGGPNAQYALLSDQPVTLLSAASSAAMPTMPAVMPTVTPGPANPPIVPIQPGAAPPSQQASMMATLSTPPTSYYVAGAVALIAATGIYYATRKK